MYGRAIAPLEAAKGMGQAHDRGGRWTERKTELEDRNWKTETGKTETGRL
jgi:hypothetical protein